MLIFKGLKLHNSIFLPNQEVSVTPTGVMFRQDANFAQARVGMVVSWQIAVLNSDLCVNNDSDNDEGANNWLNNGSVQLDESNSN